MLKYEPLVIRWNRQYNISLTQNKEGVFFLFNDGKMVDNGLDYDKISDKFNELVNNKGWEV